jgi:hypothetical protein
MRRHRILSCRYTYSDSDGVKREYAERPPVTKQVAYLDILSEANVPFDLGKDDLIRGLYLANTHACGDKPYHLRLDYSQKTSS